MSILRDDAQVALHDLYIALRESIDLYQFAGEYLHGAAAKTCASIAADRTELAARVAEAIRATGDLPAEPDRDRETAEKLREQLDALFADDREEGIIEHRRRAERELLALLDGETLSELGGGYADLLAQCRTSVTVALEQLG
ncbi:hypothetical protein ACNKU7_08225 [Microbulbifer sp. SA54]|uniref:hypothetical protein n=1 Tax=Microbulbifer sp. SA54 TaxID=3401577 RepID=UPI003AAC1A75